MKRRNKRTNKKAPVFKPFEVEPDYMIPFDEEYRCVQKDYTLEQLAEMGLDALEVKRDSLEDDIADYELIICIQLESNNPDLESIKMDRRRKQLAIVELRQVKEIIRKMMNTNEMELIAS